MTKVRIVLVAVVVLGVSAYVVWRWVPEAKTVLTEQQVADRLILTGLHSTERDVFAALGRLSAGRDEVARNYALDHLEDSSSMIQQACANALGNYDDAESSQGTLYAIGQQNAAMRMRAIQSLGYRPESPARVELLKRILAQRSLLPAERVVILNLLARMTKDSEEKKKYALELVGIGKSGDGPEHRAARTFAREILGY